MKKTYQIAFCSLGVVGLITSDGKEKVTYAGGNTSEAFTGFAIHDTAIKGIKQNEGKIISIRKGDLWCSKNPEIITTIKLEDSLSDQEKTQQAHFEFLKYLEKQWN